MRWSPHCRCLQLGRRSSWGGVQWLLLHLFQLVSSRSYCLLARRLHGVRTRTGNTVEEPFLANFCCLRLRELPRTLGFLFGSQVVVALPRKAQEIQPLVLPPPCFSLRGGLPTVWARDLRLVCTGRRLRWVRRISLISARHRGRGSSSLRLYVFVVTPTTLMVSASPVHMATVRASG